ncbi:MAG: FtsH protease activity modulator HflK [Parvibaculum sp.]
MPWNNQNGGGWQGGGGNRGPWGQGPSGGGGKQPPDLDELIRRGQEKLKQLFPGMGSGRGGGGLSAGRHGPAPLYALGIALIAILAYSSIYQVNTDEQGIVLRFGSYARSTEAGLHVKLPYPIETVLTPVVTRINKVEIGLRDSSGGITTVGDDESMMLTGDENIVDIGFTVQWRIKNASDYLFNVQNADDAVKPVAESAMREAVGQSKIEVVQTTGRDALQEKVREYMQTTLDSYKAGIEVTEVKLQKVDPPSQVIDSFRDVQAARADQERMRNEAESYANTVVPKARGDAARITQAAEAYREQIVAEAQGQAKRFLSIYEQYSKAKDVTRQRMYLETMQEVLGGSTKVIMTEDGKSNVMPYLPLTGLKPVTTPVESSATAAPGTSTGGR